MKKKEEEYELLPYGEINKLKEEISELKKKKSPKKEQSGNDTKELLRSINKLINIFEIATQFIKDDEKDVEKTKEREMETYKQIKQLNSHLNKIFEENSLIAKVVVKLNDSITDLQAMFSEFDKKLKVILKKTYIRVPGKEDNYIPKTNLTAKDKKAILEQYKNEFTR